MTDNNYIFLHIPKAGGTTLHNIFDEQSVDYPNEQIYSVKRGEFEDELKSLDRKKKLRLKLIKGHVKYGIHEEFEQDFKYITMLRDPVDRCISAFYYAKSHPRGLEETKRPDMTLHEFYDKEIVQGKLNEQTKFLANIDHDKKCTEKDFQLAAENLNKCELVGLTERFDESLLMYKKLLDWKGYPIYEIHNKTKKKKRVNEVNNQTVDMIKEKNEFDLKLYDIAVCLFEEQIKEYDKYLKFHLPIFRSRMKARNIYHSLSKKA